MKGKRIFGYELILDLYNCDLGVISSEVSLEEYVTKLCKLIEMKTFGKPLIEYFGTAKAHTKGYSLVQLIETSAIVGHFSEYWKRAYLNIFSCKPYSAKIAVKFTKEFFRVKRCKYRLLVR